MIFIAFIKLLSIDICKYIVYNHGCCSKHIFMPEWRNGRRNGLKIHRGQPRAGSSPASGKSYKFKTFEVSGVLFFVFPNPVLTNFQEMYTLFD